MRVCRAESGRLSFSCVTVSHHQRAVLTPDRLRQELSYQTVVLQRSALTSEHLSLLSSLFLTQKQFDLSLTLLVTTRLALVCLYPPPHLPLPDDLLSVRALSPLSTLHQGYEGSVPLRGSSPRWILRLPWRPLMVKGEPARSQMDPLQAGRHTDWLSLEKHHLCVPTGGGYN